MNPIRIGHSRELFWDDYLLNTSLTSVRLRGAKSCHFLYHPGLL